MKILFDTNIVLDLLLDREPFSTTASYLFSKVEEDKIIGYLCATTLTTVFYLAQKQVGKREAKKQLKKLLTLFDVAPVNRSILERAMALRFKDFEDAVLYESARSVDVKGIVTRNQTDFRSSEIHIYSPQSLYEILMAKENK